MSLQGHDGLIERGQCRFAYCRLPWRTKEALCSIIDSGRKCNEASEEQIAEQLGTSQRQFYCGRISQLRQPKCASQSDRSHPAKCGMGRDGSWWRSPCQCAPATSPQTSNRSTGCWKSSQWGNSWAAVLLDLLGPYTDESGPLHGGQPVCCALHSGWCWAPVADKLLKVEDRQVHGKQPRGSAGLSGGSPLRRRLYGVQAQDNADFFWDLAPFSPFFPFSLRQGLPSEWTESRSVRNPWAHQYIVEPTTTNEGPDHRWIVWTPVPRFLVSRDRPVGPAALC